MAGVENKPSGAWYLVPIFFGIIGGIIGYFAIKDKDNGMASNLLITGIVFTIIWWVIAVGIR